MSNEEKIDVIDFDGKVMSSATKSEIYRRKLPHRIVHVLIFDDAGRIACQVRSMQKDYCPGYISTSVGGHISAGESPEEAAKREMIEEIGKQGDVELLFSSWYEGAEKIKKILDVYLAEIDPPFILKKEEVAEIRYLKIDELHELTKDEIHPEFEFIINNSDFKKHLKSMGGI